MISITEAISDLLFVRDTVVVPGLGAFVKKPTSARVNHVANYFAKPSADIDFDPNLREDNELMVRYLSEKNEISEDEAKKQLAMFVSDCFNTLKTKKKVVLNGIGSLSYDWADDLVFLQDKTVNYNSDAFGLSDFTLEPVMRSQTKEEIKEEKAQQQKDKNTPMTEDEEAVSQDDDDDDHIRARRILVTLLIMLASAVGLAWLYFRVYHIDDKSNQIQVTAPVSTVSESTEETPQSQEVVEVIDTLTREQDSIARIGSEGTILIIAGCYDREECAITKVNSLISKGFPNALVENRGKWWYAAYGRYRSDEEAKAAWREIKKDKENKAWILSR